MVAFEKPEVEAVRYKWCRRVTGHYVAKPGGDYCKLVATIRDISVETSQGNYSFLAPKSQTDGKKTSLHQ